MKLELTFFKHVKALSTLLIIVILINFVMIYFKLDIKSITYINIPILIVFVLPTIYIHQNYYNEGKGCVYELNEEHISFTSNDQLVIYNKGDFKTINFYMSGTKCAGLALRNFPFEDYFYAKIIMNNDQEVIISCLFSKNIDKILTSLYKDVPTTKIKDFYPII
ncbi:hypothetical protein [Flavobacterium sp. 3-210]